MRVTATISLCTLMAMPVLAHSAELVVNLQIPQLNVAEYHRPYVAVWVEDGQNTARANLAVWYQQKANAEGHGTKWLPDLRQWWRRSGRNLQVPVDGITGPTRPAGEHRLRFDQNHPQLRALPAGNYTLVVEAAREVGGRELLRIPFTWRGEGTGSAQGNSELGRITLVSKR